MLKKSLVFMSILAFSFQAAAGNTPSMKGSDADDDTRSMATSHQPAEPANISQRLVFLDQGQDPDMLDFLAKKYPTTLSKTKEDFSETKRETAKSLLKLMQQLKAHNLTVETYAKTRWENLVCQQILEDGPDYLNPIEEKKALTAYFRNNPSQMEERHQLAQQDENRSYLTDIILGAQWIKSIRQKHGDCPIVFLGRSPCFLQVAYEELCKNESPENPLCCDHIYHLNFSGSPDIENTRTDTFFTENTQRTRERNLVTSGNRDFYCTYMTQKGMDHISPKFYLVDLISTGGSLNSALRTMRFYYEQHLGRTMPDIHFMGLGLPLVEDRSLELYTYNAAAGHITFNDLPELGVRPLVIPASPIYINHRPLKNLLDQDAFQRAAVPGIEFPAEKWDAEFSSELETGGRFHKETYELLRSEVQMII
jgi:hypothetical protein